MEDAPRMASVDALEETTLLVITKDDFQELLHSHPEIAMPIMRAVWRACANPISAPIDELRQKNDELAQAYLALQETMQRKSDFLTVVAHELRTPLTAIKGYGHFMRMGTLQGENLDRAVEAIVNNTDAIVRLINNILFLQELELIPPTFEPVDVRNVDQRDLDHGAFPRRQRARPDLPAQSAARSARGLRRSRRVDASHRRVDRQRREVQPQRRRDRHHGGH